MTPKSQTFREIELDRELKVCRAINLEHLSEMDKLRKIAEDQNKTHLEYITRLKEGITKLHNEAEQRENCIKKLNEKILQSSTLVDILKVVLEEKED